MLKERYEVKPKMIGRIGAKAQDLRRDKEAMEENKFIYLMS